MDIYWILNGQKATPSYWEGVNDFMKFVRHHNNDSDVFCPCQQCHHYKKLSQSTVAEHIFSNGMKCTYISWTKHGEPYDQPVLDPLADADLPEAHQIEDED